MGNDTRKVEAMVDGEWVRCTLDQLLPGALFRMFEPDGEPVRDPKGRTEFVVDRKPEKVVTEGKRSWMVHIKE